MDIQLRTELPGPRSRALMESRRKEVARGLFHATPPFLANSGAEAVENAVKIARAHTKRQAVLAFEHAFHGRTYLAMSLTGKVKPYRHGFGPFAPEVYRAPFPHAASACDPCLDAVREVITYQVGADQLAAIVVEPVLGEGGVVPAPIPFLRGLRAICDEHGIVLVIDEIQTGFGRTGTLFACEHYGVVPDLITLAKGLGAGLPIAAVTGRAEIMDAPGEGGIGGTFGGNPLSCAAALAVLDAFEADGGALLARARALGDALATRLTTLAQRHPCIGEVRGLGAMRGIEIVNRSSKKPDPGGAAALARYCYEHGVILMTGGANGNVARVLVPLVITDEQLDEGFAVIDDGLQQIDELQG